MDDNIKWITRNGVHIPLTNDYMNNKIRNSVAKKKKDNKKIDYNKYLEKRKTTVDAFIAEGGVVKVLSEEKANELVKLGFDEELLPYAYPLKDEYSISEAMKKNENWLETYTNEALKTKERDAKYQIDRQEMALERQKHEEVEILLNDLNKNYNSGNKSSFKDYETDDVSYEIEHDTLKTITNDWGYKDSTTKYFDNLTGEQKIAVEDYTDENAKYNYRYFNNILNGHWNNEIDMEGKKRMKDIDNAINGSTIDENLYLYRATNKAHITKDALLFNKGYSSTSLFKDVVENFDNQDILKIRVPKGTKGLYIGSNTMSLVAEYEVLLGRNTKLQVLGKNKDGTIECILIN